MTRVGVGVGVEVGGGGGGGGGGVVSWLNCLSKVLAIAQSKPVDLQRRMVYDGGHNLYSIVCLQYTVHSHQS